MYMSYQHNKHKKHTYLVDKNCHPQTIALLKTRAAPLGIEIRVREWSDMKVDEDTFGIMLQYPDTFGRINNFNQFVKEARLDGVIVTAATDLMALCLLKPPGEWGADIAIGSAQRFGVPLGYGGTFVVLIHRTTRRLLGLH